MAVNGIKPNGSDAASAPVSSQNANAAKSAQVNKAGMNAFAKAAAATPTVQEAANVQISPKAKEMSLARKVVEETPDVREDKVAKFKELIAKGQYKPDATKIADGIVREALKDSLAKDPEAVLDN